MKPNIKEHLTKYNQSQNLPTDDESLIETLLEANTVWEGDYDRHRWWTCYTCVVQVDGMFIGFQDAKTTGDDSARDKGWEFEPDTIIEYEPYQEVQTLYREKK